MSPLSFEFVSVTFAPSAIVSVPAVRLPPLMFHSPEALSAASTVSALSVPTLRLPIVRLSPPEIEALEALTTTLPSSTAAPSSSETLPPFSSSAPAPPTLPASVTEAFEPTAILLPSPIVAPFSETLSVPELSITFAFKSALSNAIVTLASLLTVMPLKPETSVFVSVSAEVPPRMTDPEPEKLAFSSVRLALSMVAPLLTVTSKRLSSASPVAVTLTCPLSFISPRTLTCD